MNNPKYAPSVSEQEAIADFLVSAVIEDGTGQAECDRCVGEPPSARYFLASLAPRDLDLTAGTLRRGRVVPSASGFEFDVESPTGTLTVDASISVYYRVFPGFEEQLAHSDSALLTPEERSRRVFRLVPVFQRHQVDIHELELVLKENEPQQYLFVEHFTDLLDAASRRAATDPACYRRDPNDGGDIHVPGPSLESPSAFDGWLARLPGNAVTPQWRARLSVAMRPITSGRWRVTTLLENDSRNPIRMVKVRGREEPRYDDARDHFLFRVQLTVKPKTARIAPIRMNLGPDAYRYDPYLNAYAINCGVEGRINEGAVEFLRSVPAPIHTTDRALSNEHSSCSFTLLSKRPIPALEQLARDLAAYVNDSAWSTDGLPPEQKARKELDRQAVHAELARYQDGIEWLQRDARLELAFRLANETMIRLDQKTGRAHKGWRLFQLVFIVSQLSALAWREHKPADFTKGLWSDGMDQDPTSAATVLWFPTGQGKTEAYLGLMACALFYDRCRGKTRGVTAWCRFPLRLLSLQQTQRQLDFIAAADEIRREHAKSITKSGGDIGDAFAVGFYVGEGNTPNTLSRDDTTLRSLISDPKKRHEQVVVDRCPQCGSRNIEIPPPDPTELRLKHVCTSCQFQLPIYVVDNEIYRYLPAVVVGTIDKLAMIGLSDRFGALLGDVDSECPLHGLARGGKCHERRAKGHPRGGCSPLPKPLYDPSPSLEILDELHMIDEELGAFAGHYEGILSATQQELTRLRRPDGRPIRMKVIATTATIKGEDRQCDHLLGLHSVVFPLPGPDLDRSFYWTVHRDRPLRRFVGVLPHRTTAEQAMARILQSFHAAIRWLEEKGPAAVPGLYVSSAPHFGELLELYRVSLTYVTSLVDFGKLRRTMDTQVNDFLGQRGLREVVVRELSGDTRFDDVRATLEDLQSGGRTEAVIATSMISHGVDINRLNVMVFNGMPKSMAEYIQASSRIGRAYLGVVFMIFNPVRERDRSHFRYHGKFHEYLDRMVEPVAINRWSRYAAQKTLPGLFMAHILQVGNREYWDKGRSPAHLHDLTRMKEAIRPIESGGLKTAQEPEILRVLEDAYVVQREGALELRREITEDIHTALASLRVAGAGAASITRGRPTYRGTPDYLGLRYEPMVSLRDVAEGLPFIPLTEKRKQS